MRILDLLQSFEPKTCSSLSFIYMYTVGPQEQRVHSVDVLLRCITKIFPFLGFEKLTTGVKKGQQPKSREECA